MSNIIKSRYSLFHEINCRNCKKLIPHKELAYCPYCASYEEIPSHLDLLETVKELKEEVQILKNKIENL